ncbi:2-iminoacetate synthase ThiH [Fluviicola taffensis]|uniref:Tyrosine lyase ThiH n=1 Tax=Fluviicola taffensis (strain DSM 16823 / NCIMB 13979 / RW262) TaxID=755732 RepID=F2IHL0_FLUTR|nr:2-iminoacetate synthase ThiH [Fluviicola taffensis]AEA44788.1 tyrosine lyase ThiH [Fluviicola taffensis DSM 16823]
MDFKSLFQNTNWDETKASIYAKTAVDVERALNASKRNLEDFKALISPAAAPYLEQMAQMSHELTKKRFGKTIQLYAPMYLSNECNNICTYCGFSFDNKILRKTLTDEEILQEVAFLKSKGFNHVLLVTGEANRTVHVPYFKHTMDLIRSQFANISIEVQPLETNEYQELHEAGVYSVLVYQETYHQEVYKAYHPKGKKSNFEYRLDTPDRCGTAEIHKIGLGVLLGLEDWRTDSFYCALHLDYLQKAYWKSKYSISFPRMRPAEGIIEPNVIVGDKELVQLICAYRLLNEDVELSISTRESEHFRNNVIPLGVTTMSAESKTNPGGYVVEPESLEQFEISDERSVEEIAALIRKNGYEAVWKDWDRSFISSPFGGGQRGRTDDLIVERDNHV